MPALTPPSSAPDFPATAREKAMLTWLLTALGATHPGEFTLGSASVDAGFRRYFRVTHGNLSRIVMDAPPDKEETGPFLSVAALFRNAGLRVPTILAENLPQGFLLLDDLGSETYLQHFKAAGTDRADALMSDAIDALIVWQQATQPNVLPIYDRALLQKELALYPTWYLERHLGASLSDKDRAVLHNGFELLINSAINQPQVYVHRDYMPRNLMLSAPGLPNPGILDFQDAVLGPITYDIASLTRDAFISWDEAKVIDWAARYWQRARAAGLPVDDDFGEFFRAFEWMGLQRHLKVLGIFARLNYRDNKPHYLADQPRFSQYIRKCCDRYRAFGPFLQLIDRLEGVALSPVGLTF